MNNRLEKGTLLGSYGAASSLISPLSHLWLKRRIKAGKEDPARIGERHGRPLRARPSGNLIWMHGASVGETMMLMPIINRFLTHYPNAHILVTSQTMTSAEILNKQLPNGAFHQYAPLDYPKAVRGFLEHWQPDLAIFGESEIWPNLILESRKRQIPMALINARMSPKSLQGWGKHKKLAQKLFGGFDLILAADNETAVGLSWLTGKTIESSGNLKDAAPTLPVDETEFKKLRRATTNRAIWCAASTHEGEDELIIAAHQKILKRYPKALLILAPRHPKRAMHIKTLLNNAELSYAARSKNSAVTRDTQVYLFDSIGEMGLVFRLSQISFVCGSLIKGLKGHNPLEPARLDNAILTGMYISSFADTYMSMIAHDAAQRILTPDKISDSVLELLSDRQDLKNRQMQAKQYATGRDAVLDFVWNQLTPFIPVMGSALSLSGDQPLIGKGS